MERKPQAVSFIAKTGVIAGLYAVLTIALAPISYGAIQCRISEVMTLLPLFFVEAIPGLIIGCLLANIMSGVVMDMVFGTLATALAAVSTYFLGKFIRGKAKPFIGALPPVLFNAIILPIMWYFFTEWGGLYWYNFVSVLIGQTISVYVLGIPLYYALKKTKIVGSK